MADYRSGPFPGTEMITAQHPQVVHRGLRTLLQSEHPLACDIETYGLGALARQIKTVTFATADLAVICLAEDPVQARLVTSMLDALVRDHRQLAFHNSAFDMPSLAMAGLARPAHAAIVTDTMIWSRLGWPDIMVRKGLEDMAHRVLGIPKGAESDRDVAKSMGMTIAEMYAALHVDRPTFALGAAADALVTARLATVLPNLVAAKLVTANPFQAGRMMITRDDACRLVEREQVINRMLLRRSMRGLRIDPDELWRFTRETETELRLADLALSEQGISTPAQLVAALEAAMAIPAGYPRTKKTGRPSTVAAHLQTLDHPLVTAWVRRAQIKKVLDDYLTKTESLAIDHPDGSRRIHPRTSLLAATTGRMSVGDPPLQQFSGPARGIVLADAGDVMVSIDWAQIEPVVAANVAGDVDALETYETDGDLYAGVAAAARVPRKVAKVVLLAQMYGEGMAKLAADLGISVDEAKELKTTIFAALPQTQRLLYRLRDIADTHRVIVTMSGRVIDIPMGTYDGRTSVQTHKGVNYFVQGSAYDLLAEALWAIEGAGLGDAVYLALHDELVVSKDAAADVEAIMATPPARLIEIARRIPILRTDRCVLGDRWGVA